MTKPLSLSEQAIRRGSEPDRFAAIERIARYHVALLDAGIPSKEAAALIADEYRAELKARMTGGRYGSTS